MASADFEFGFRAPPEGYKPGMETGEDGASPKFDWSKFKFTDLTGEETGFVGKAHQRAPSPLRSSPPQSPASHSPRKRSARQISTSPVHGRPASPVQERSQSPVEAMKRGIKFIRTLSGQLLTGSGDRSPTSSRSSSPVPMDHRSRSPSPARMDVTEEETQLNEEISQRAKGENGIFKKLADGSKFKNDILAIFNEIEKNSPLSAELEARLNKALDRLENYCSRWQTSIEEEELLQADFLWAAGLSEQALNIYQKYPEKLASSERVDKVLPKDQLELLLRIRDTAKNLEPKDKVLEFYRFCIDQAFAGATRKGSPRSPTAENPTTAFLQKAGLLLQTVPQELFRLNFKTSQAEMNIKENEAFKIVYKADKILNQLPSSDFKQQLLGIVQEIFKKAPLSADEILKLDQTLNRLDTFCKKQEDEAEKELLRADLLFLCHAGKSSEALKIYQKHNDTLVSKGRADKRILPAHFELLKQIEKRALKQEPKDKAAQFYELCISHAFSQQASASKVSPQEASRRMTKFLSKALMALEQRPRDLLEIDLSNAIAVTPEIEQHVSDIVQKTALSIVKQNQELMALLNKEPKLSNPAAASEIAFARALTKLLFIDGKLNTGIIPTIERILLKETGQSAFRDHMKAVLAQFFHSPELCQQLHSIKSPSNERAQLFVRTTLQIPSTTPLTEKDACEAAFVSLLILPRQHDEIASCYATVCLVQASINDLPSLLRGVKEVVEDGVITRERGGTTRGSQRTTVEFLAAPYMAIETMKTNEDKIVFKMQLPSGKIGSVSAYDLPLIKSMCDSLGISQEGFNEFLKHQAQKGKTISLTMPELLGLVVEFLISSKGFIKESDKDKAIKDATFAIEACHQAPILRALENSIIAMAQDDSRVNKNLEDYRKYFKESAAETIVRTLSKQFPKVPEERLRSVAGLIVGVLPLQNIGFFAHPPTEHLYLYFKDKNGAIHEIRDMDKYLNLAADLLVSICKERAALDKSGALLYLTTDKGKSAFKEQLRSAVQEDPIGSDIQPMYKPWEASAEFILSVYFNNRATIQKSDIHEETDPGKRFIKIVRLCQKNRPLDLAGSRVIAGTKSHECTLIPNHPSMAGVDIDTPDWYNRFVEAGQSIWKEPIRDGKVLKEIYKKVFEEETIKGKTFENEFIKNKEERLELKKNFLKEMQKKAVALSDGEISEDKASKMKADDLFKYLADKMPYDEFVQLVAKHLEKRKEPLTEKELSWFDSYTVQLIPEHIRHQFAQSMVTFADSNYPEVITSQSGKIYSDVMFLSYGVSPRTGKPTLFFTNNNMKYMKAVVAKFSGFTEVIKLPATAEKQQKRYQTGITEAEKEHLRKKERANVEKVFSLFQQELMKYVDLLSQLEGPEPINMARDILELLKKLNETTEATYEDDINFCVAELERLSLQEEEELVALQLPSFSMDISGEVLSPQAQKVGQQGDMALHDQDVAMASATKSESLAMPGPDEDLSMAPPILPPERPMSLAMPDLEEAVEMVAKQDKTQEKQAPVPTAGTQIDIPSLRQTVATVFSSLSQRVKGWFLGA
jgi:hypothetical protein